MFNSGMKRFILPLALGLMIGSGYLVAAESTTKDLPSSVTANRPARVIGVNGEGEFKRMGEDIYLEMKDGKKFRSSPDTNDECAKHVGKGAIQFAGYAYDTPDNETYAGVLRSVRSIEPAGAG